MMIKLFNVDCIEYMEKLADKVFDLAIVDPPYGHGNNLIVKGNTRSKIATAKQFKAFDNSASPDEYYFKELMRVSKNQIIWGANHFASKFNSSSSCWIVWDKKNGSTHFADCELAYASFGTAVRKFEYLWHGMHQGSYGGDVRKNEVKIHPTQKPIALYRWLLQNYAKPEFSILDTHLGSGSSAIAAHEFGCDFVGCEIDSEFYSAAVNRVNEQTQQMDLIGYCND